MQVELHPTPMALYRLVVKQSQSSRRAEALLRSPGLPDAVREHLTEHVMPLDDDRAGEERHTRWVLIPMGHRPPTDNHQLFGLVTNGRLIITAGTLAYAPPERVLSDLSLALVRDKLNKTAPNVPIEVSYTDRVLDTDLDLAGWNTPGLERHPGTR